MTSPSMTVHDWLELIEQSCEHDLGAWRVWPGPQFDYLENAAPIRDGEERCPLCALALAMGSVAGYKGAWHLALRDAFGAMGTHTIEAARVIAIAADYPLDKLHWRHRVVRLRLGRIFRIPRRWL